MEKIFITTSDGVKIAANLYEVKPRRVEEWLVLVHMMPATKESWDFLAKSFQAIGYESIAIDLRGHGESSGGPGGFNDFSDTEHKKSILDIEAAVDYLIENKNVLPDRISFIGASIGANLSLKYVSENKNFKTAALLSSGLNYRGIETEQLVKNLASGQRILFVSSRDDIRSGGNNNAEENQKLYELAPEDVEKKIQIYETGGHGTDILKNQRDLLNLIIEFIKANK